MAVQPNSTSPNSTGEFARIDRLSKIIGSTSDRVLIGIGDDTAVAQPPQNKLLLCTDAMVEGVHFDLTFCTPEELGHKSLAATMSDIAAMNGEPLYALFSIALPPTIADSFLDEFYIGAKSLAGLIGIDIVGGDLTASRHDLFIDVTGVGQAASPVARSGAKPGDVVLVSGCPGASAAGLYSLKNVGRDKTPAALLKAHLLPMPRFDLLKHLATAFTSLIDISDGLSSELDHLAKASRVGFEIHAENIPIHEDVLKIANSEQATQWALSGGEDYELLATVDHAWVKAHGAPKGFTIIGRVVEPEKGLTLWSKNGLSQPLVASGFDHFSRVSTRD
jgi:thiamine-monophosphate kinase